VREQDLVFLLVDPDEGQCTKDQERKGKPTEAERAQALL
jgi:hypothetical protein